MNMDKDKMLKYTIKGDLYILDAMSLIEENEHRSLIVLGEDDVVVGTISDGDIRKDLLRGELLSAKIRDVMNLNFIFLKKTDINEAKKIFDKSRIFLLPILDDDNRIIDIIESY
jgi:CBS domain-containing protein